MLFLHGCIDKKKCIQEAGSYHPRYLHQDKIFCAHKTTKDLENGATSHRDRFHSTVPPYLVRIRAIQRAWFYNSEILKITTAS